MRAAPNIGSLLSGGDTDGKGKRLYIKRWYTKGLYTKAVAVGVAGIAFAGLGGTASATSAAGKQYEKIVAPFNKLATANNAPPVPKLKTVISSTEKGLRSAHWPKKAAKDVKTLATELASVESLFVNEAKSNANYTPTKKEASKATKFLSQITKVHKDLGLPATNQNGL